MPVQHPFFASFRVYYEDTDAGGVMYHARYLNFFERARTEWLRQFGVEQARLADQHDVVFAVRQAQVEFIRPARLDDRLRISCQPLKKGPASLVFYQEMHAADNRLLASAHIKVACVRASSFRPVPWRKTIVADIFATALDTAGDG